MIKRVQFNISLFLPSFLPSLAWTPVCLLNAGEQAIVPSVHTHSAGLLWTRDRPVAETSTGQPTVPTSDEHPFPRRD